MDGEKMTSPPKKEIVGTKKIPDSPTYDDLVEFVRWCECKQPEAVEIMKKYGYVFYDLDTNSWQKLAFTFYTDLCEIHTKVQNLFEVDK